MNHFNVAEHIARINAEQGITTQIRELCKLTVGAIKRSRLSYDEIKARGGPCPSTINKWDDGDVNRPFLDTLIRALVAIDERGAITALVDHLKAEQEINDRMATKV